MNASLDLDLQGKARAYLKRQLLLCWHYKFVCGHTHAHFDSRAMCTQGSFNVGPPDTSQWTHEATVLRRHAGLSCLWFVIKP